MSELRIRCSAIGKIMTPAKSKGESLSVTAKGYIQELFLEREYGIKKEFWSRYTDKGIAVEKDSIRLANEVLDWGLTEDYIDFGGQEYFSNEWIHGATDVCTDWILADVKSCWSGTTYPWFNNDKKEQDEIKKIISKDYFYQMQGYMWLTGHDKCHLAFTLIDTPENMILDEIRREHWKQDSYWQGDENHEIVDFVRSKHSFKHIPKSRRVTNFIINKDEAALESIKSKVLEVRAYYEELKTEENNLILLQSINKK